MKVMNADRTRLIIFLLILLGIGTTLYRESLSTLLTIVLHRENSSHTIFVPFISGYFLWLRFEKIQKINPQSNIFPGSALMICGLLLLLLSISESSLILSILSLLFIVGALLLIIFGKEIFRETLFPLFFLVTIIPLPESLYNQFAELMRQTNTIVAVQVTKTLGVPILRDGFDIYLPNLQLFVAQSCSGIRYLLSYFTFSIVYAFLYKKSPFIRFLVIICSIPLAFFASITRLSVIFLSAHYISPVIAEHRPHIILSWIVFVMILVGVIAFDQYISRFIRKIQKQNTSIIG